MRPIGSNLLEPEKSVDDEPLHPPPPHNLEKPVAERVEDVLGRWVPEDLEMALIDEVAELNADARRLMPQAQRTSVAVPLGIPPPSIESSWLTPVAHRSPGHSSSAEGRASSTSIRGYTTMPASVIWNECRPRKASVPRSLRTSSSRSACMPDTTS